MNPWIFENTEFGKIEISRGEDGVPTVAYFALQDYETLISKSGFFRDAWKTEFRVNWAKGEACLFVMSPRRFASLKY